MKTRTSLGLIAAGLLSLVGTVKIEGALDKRYVEAYAPVMRCANENLPVPYGIVMNANDERRRINNMRDGVRAAGVVVYSVLFGLGAGSYVAGRERRKISKEIRREREAKDSR